MGGTLAPVVDLLGADYPEVQPITSTILLAISGLVRMEMCYS